MAYLCVYLGNTSRRLPGARWLHSSIAARSTSNSRHPTPPGGELFEHGRVNSLTRDTLVCVWIGDELRNMACGLDKSASSTRLADAVPCCVQSTLRMPLSRSLTRCSAARVALASYAGPSRIPTQITRAVASWRGRSRREDRQLPHSLKGPLSFDAQVVAIQSA